jgi:hypothetical protein
MPRREESMIIDVGEKVHIIERRYFVGDISRHLVGEIVKSSDNAIRVKGYVWVLDVRKGFIRKPEARERLLYPGDRSTINIIPKEVNLDEVKYVISPEGVIVTDGKKFRLDIREFGSKR